MARIEQLHGEPTGSITLNDKDYPVYVEPPVKPNGQKQLTICQEHIAAGAVSDLLDAFVLEGMAIPGTKDNPEPLVRYGISCKGCTFLGRCGLTLTQYDSRGKELNSGRITR